MVRVDPPIDAWADALTHPGAVVATGHQALLWHPGILAKLIAARTAAERFGCQPLYVVVDQDVHDALTLELPRAEGDRLRVDRVPLGRQTPDVPTGFHPPVALDLSRVSNERLRHALAGASGDTLARQMTAALLPLIEPVVDELRVCYVSELSRTDRYRRFVETMIADARPCAEAYNAALREAGVRDVAPLRIDASQVELPLWLCRWNQPRQRVFVRLSEPMPQGDLTPRALVLSAVMRSIFSDLFIHGTGGEIYDRATEIWWRTWRGEALRPRAVATADLTLAFDVPVATRDELAQAVWRRHHLRHNMDPRRKRDLLARMAATRDRTQRAAIFRQMHELNRRRIAEQPRRLAQADAAVQRARAGVANAAIAARRDWCVGLYPPSRLAELRDAIAAAAPAAGDTMRP